MTVSRTNNNSTTTDPNVLSRRGPSLVVIPFLGSLVPHRQRAVLFARQRYLEIFSRIWLTLGHFWKKVILGYSEIGKLWFLRMLSRKETR